MRRFFLTAAILLCAMPAIAQQTVVVTTPKYRDANNAVQVAGASVCLNLDGSVCSSSGSSSGATALVPTATTALASSLVVKTGATSLLGFTAVSTATGYFLIFDAASAPADGAVTPLDCIAYPTANAPIGVDYGSAPLKVTAGAVVVFSSTGCFTKTASATAYISGKAS